MSVIKAGTYRFNDELTVPKNNELDENGKIVVNMPFETTVYIDAYEEEFGIINSKVVCSGMIVSPYILEETACVDVTYVIQSLIPDIVLGDESLNSVCPFTLWVYNGEPYGYTSEKWNKETTSFQTITITSDTEVDENFYEMWFAPNTKPVADEEKPIFDVITEKLALIAENEQKVYDAGYAEGEASGGDTTQFDRYFSGEDVELTVNSARIKEYSFMDALNLKAINLPNATEIGELAFSGCSNLESIEMPNVEYIGSGAFFLALSEISLKIPSSVKVIDENAFSECGITEVTFEGIPESIANNTFQDCPNLDTINVPWSFGEVAGAPWGTSYSTLINYDYNVGG